MLFGSFYSDWDVFHQPPLDSHWPTLHATQGGWGTPRVAKKIIAVDIGDCLGRL